MGVNVVCSVCGTAHYFAHSCGGTPTYTGPPAPTDAESSVYAEHREKCGCRSENSVWVEICDYHRGFAAGVERASVNTMFDVERNQRIAKLDAENAALRDRANHHEDDHRAVSRIWKALGDPEFDNWEISEHVTELHERAEKAERELERARVGGGMMDEGCPVCQEHGAACVHAYWDTPLASPSSAVALPPGYSDQVRVLQDDSADLRARLEVTEGALDRMVGLASDQQNRAIAAEKRAETAELELARAREALREIETLGLIAGEGVNARLDKCLTIARRALAPDGGEGER